MLNLNESEIDNIIDLLKPYYGLPLNEVLFCDKDLVLGFFDGSHSRWIWVDLHPKTLGIFPLNELRVKIKNNKKPLYLFLKSHFSGKTLLSVERKKYYGRVVTFYFQDDCSVQVRLFASGRNIIAETKDKKMHLNKPFDLVAADSAEGFACRSWSEIHSRWENLRASSKVQSIKSDQKSHEKLIAKKTRALDKTKKALNEAESSIWLKAGEALTSGQSLQLSSELSGCVNKEHSLAWNIENCFKKHKQSVSKKQGMLDRVQLLEKDIKKLQAGPAKKTVTPAKKLLEVASAKGRRWPMADNLVLTIGKSAQDNLKLLRRVKPWHLWLHISGRPSAHGFIECQRKQVIPESVIHEAAKKLLTESFGEKADKYKGEKFEVIYAECRYIRPIKGDKHGRVNFQNEKVVTVKMS